MPTLSQLNTLLKAATVSITGLSAGFVRDEYLPDSAPFIPQGSDCAFLFVTTVDSPVNKQVDTQYHYNDSLNAGQTRTTTRTIQCKWTFYGPNSFDLAGQLRDGILTESIRHTLAASTVFPIPSITAPTRIPESINNQWWERSDVSVQFNVQNIQTDLVPYLQSATVNVQSAAYTITTHIPPL